MRRVAWESEGDSTTDPTGPGGAAGAAFARAYDRIPFHARCERRDGGVGGVPFASQYQPRVPGYCSADVVQGLTRLLTHSVAQDLENSRMTINVS